MVATAVGTPSGAPGTDHQTAGCCLTQLSLELLSLPLGETGTWGCSQGQDLPALAPAGGSLQALHWTKVLPPHPETGSRFQRMSWESKFHSHFLLNIKTPLISHRKQAHVGLFLPWFIFTLSFLRCLSHGCNESAPTPQACESPTAAAGRTLSPSTARQGRQQMRCQ